MKQRAITIKDLATALNLSTSTVSKALKGSHEISAETQAKVKEYAKQQNYRPNPIAQNLRKGSSKSIAVIVPNIDNNFFSQIINGIETIAFKKEYNVIVTQTHESYEREVRNTQHHFSRSVDGLLVSLSSETENVDHFIEAQKNGLPIVFFDRVSDQIETHKVISSNYKGAYDATLHLIKQGYKRIAQITSAGFLSITVERLAGYIKALEENNIKVDEQFIKYCAHGGMIKEEVHEVINELFALKVTPDAILTASDRLSTTTLDMLSQMKIKVPEQVAIAGFTNSVNTGIFNPSLTTVVQPAFEMGKTATELLIQIIESKRPVTQFEKIILDTELIVRESSRKKKVN
ncbi:MAG: LacI family DNA-binding transcriptional regulator [Ginsengibacter sp.]